MAIVITDDYLVAAAQAVGLDLPEDLRPGVRRYLALAAAMAEVVMAVPLTEDDEPAPVFTPVESPR